MALPHYAIEECGLCCDDLEHCHGTALVTDDAYVCSDDPDCAVAIGAHLFVVDYPEDDAAR